MEDRELEARDVRCAEVSHREGLSGFRMTVAQIRGVVSQNPFDVLLAKIGRFKSYLSRKFASPRAFKLSDVGGSIDQLPPTPRSMFGTRGHVSRGSCTKMSLDSSLPQSCPCGRVATATPSESDGLTDCVGFR